ncbi:type II secretion system secretin GspD [Sulfitobacter sabulilitoris]|uniref:Type II secretion system protein GspD n=1 Tax=Sulfitobacter sabulilitoris TaxID=2562655 RepID=A0A5S3PFB1_9RHOB|nr:type II secretion system secretin GspD [Sulfitobacter sabulilitoris]TMM51800.1 type II secretion system protein GspD [Sulfitobacter sabulilitoris]
MALIRSLALILMTVCAAPLAAQDLAEDGETFIINLRDSDISVLTEEVSKITERTLIVDPNLGGEVTVVSAQPLSQSGVWALFQSILRVRGFVAVQSGVVWEIVPEAEARTKSGSAASGTAGSQDFVTQLMPLNRLPSAEAVRVLRPLVDPSGYIEALSDPNAIVITDTQANVDRIAAIARTFDGNAGVSAQVIRFNFADASAVGAAIVEVLGDAGTGARLSVDANSNVLLVRGTEADIDQIRRLAQAMDVAPRQNPRAALSTYVYKLQFADAEVVAEIVRGTLQGGADLTNPVAQTIGEGDTAQEVLLPGAPAQDVAIQASTATNAVIVRGTSRQIAEVTSLIKALDVRGAQVMIEAAIVEVSGDVADRLGVQLGLGQNLPQGALAATSFSNGGTSVQAVLSALGQSVGGALSTGLTVGASSGDFGLLVQALSQSTSAKLLSTPSITTLDNKPATIVVGQNVPFRTGSFATDGNTVTPFTTIERRDVGITMEVLPRVTAGGVVRLEISQEVSSLVNATVQGAADLITNRRVINTTVQAMNGGTVVLGGLITDDSQFTENKVPGLGDIPVVGELFKSRSGQKNRRTLFVFMRPTVIGGQHDAQTAAQRSFQRLRQADAAEPPRSVLQERKVRKLPLEINGLY